MPAQRTSRGLEIICCFLIIKSDNTSTWAGQALLLGQHWPSGTGAIEPSSHRSTIQRTCSKTHIDTDCLSRKYGLEKRWEILHIFSQSPGSNSCCRTPLCSDNKSLEGSARCLRSDISAHFCGWFKHSGKSCFFRTRCRKMQMIIPLEDRICPGSVATGKGLWKGSSCPRALEQDRHSGKTGKILGG